MPDLEPARPRDVLARPVLLLALLGLALNDHLWKAQAPGFVTGKLSDVTGLFAAPLVAWALLDLLAPRRATRAALGGLAALVAAAFAALKTLEPARAAWIGAHAQVGLPARVAPDLSDLGCLPFAALAVWFGARHLARPAPPAAWPRLAGAARVAVVLAFVVLTTATSVVLPPAPIRARALPGEGEGRAEVDRRAYDDRPFEVALPPGPWRSARAVVRLVRSSDWPQASEPAPERQDVVERVLLDVTAPPGGSLEDPVILALPPGDLSRAVEAGDDQGPGVSVVSLPAAETARYLDGPQVEVRAERVDGRTLVVRFLLEPMPYAEDK